MLTRRALLGQGIAAAGAALVGVTGCRSVPAPVRIATNVWTGYEPLYEARRDGRLPEGVQLIELLNATQVLAAMRTGIVECAALTLDEVMLLLSRGVPLRVVAVLDASAGADAIVARSIASLAELRGARVAVENTAVGAYFLSRVMERAGLGEADVQLVRMDVSEHERAFTEGAVDAVVTFDPYRARLVALGGKVLMDSTSLPDEIVDVLVVGASLLDQPGTRTRLAQVLRAVDTVVRELRPGSPRYASMSKRLGLTPEQASEAFGRIRLYTLEDMSRLLDAGEPPLVGLARSLGARLVHAELLPSVPAVDALLDPRVLREARS